MLHSHLSLFEKYFMSFKNIHVRGKKLKTWLILFINAHCGPKKQLKKSLFSSDKIRQTLTWLFTIQKVFLIWISRSFKKGASDNTISYFD